jgi:hypothetical protein
MIIDPVPAKTAYEPPALIRLGSLEDLTKQSSESSLWQCNGPWHKWPPHDCPPQFS